VAERAESGLVPNADEDEIALEVVEGPCDLMALLHHPVRIASAVAGGTQRAATESLGVDLVEVERFAV
jgi:hypothetical protein